MKKLIYTALMMATIVGCQEVIEELRPAENAEVFKAEVEYFANVLDAIEIEMVDGTEVRTIFVDYGKCGGTDSICYAKLLTYGFDEGCLAGSHSTIEGKDALLPYLGNKLFGSLTDTINRRYEDFSHVLSQS
mgnify:CR=1 FL=1